jgi:hypothetical protein
VPVGVPHHVVIPPPSDRREPLVKGPYEVVVAFVVDANRRLAAVLMGKRHCDLEWANRIEAHRLDASDLIPADVRARLRRPEAPVQLIQGEWQAHC